MEQKIRDKIKAADMVLVGIGEEFAPVLPIPEDGLEEFHRSRSYEELPEDCVQIQAYNRLQELLKGKPYFIVTMNTDDLIYRSLLDPAQIVAPCGSMQKMQCSQHILPAGAIRDRVLESKNPKEAVCPECGEKLQFHTVAAKGYLEQGYLPQWEKYTGFLQFTLNRRLCILELGVGFRYPQVIRFPFEKTAYYNKKADLIRVNSKFPQLPHELAGKGISVPMMPVEFLLES